MYQLLGQVDADHGNYEALLTALESPFSYPKVAALSNAELKTLRQQPHQTLPELAARVERLVQKCCQVTS